MARAVFVLGALSLLLPAHAAGLQHSFRSSIMGRVCGPEKFKASIFSPRCVISEL
jgi:hypothetical protein